MKRLLTFVCLMAPWIFGSGKDLAAQDLVIRNARILDGNGGTIPRGAVVVRDGKIVSVSAGAPTAQAATGIDAQGMTVVPGFIDAHRHLMRGNAEQWLKEQAADRMREYLEAGFTSILSAGDSLEAIVELRRRLKQGEITGPRLVTSGRANTAGPPEEARVAVRTAVEAGVDAIKTTFTSTPGGTEKETLAAIVEEAKRLGVPTIVHVTAVPDMITVVQTGATRLVHTPHTGTLEGTNGARLVATAGIPVTSTLGVYVPMFDEENVGRLVPGGRPATMTSDNLGRGAQGPINARLLWDAGVTYGFGTDTPYLPKDALAHELRPLQLFFSPKDIVTILTRNAAAALGLSNEIGTLEPGKLADIVIIAGDPLADIRNLLNVKVVINGGKIVVDKR